MSDPSASRPPRNAPWLAPLQFLGALALLQYVPVLVAAALRAVGWLRDDAPAHDLRAIWTGIFAVGCLAVVGLAALSRPPVPWRPVRAAATLLVYLPAAAGWLLATIGYLHAMHALGHPVRPQPGLQEVVDLGPHDWRVVPHAFAIVVAAPLAEEIVFRGYLLEACGLLLARWPAQLVTAAVFGLVHGLDYAPPMALLGLVFGWLRQRHRSLWPSMLAHMVHNGLTMACALWAPDAIASMYPR